MCDKYELHVLLQRARLPQLLQRRVPLFFAFQGPGKRGHLVGDLAKSEIRQLQ